MSDHLANIIAGTARLIAGVSVSGPENKLPTAHTIFYANHSSHLDFVVLWSILPPHIRQRTRPIAAQDYWENSKLRRYVSQDVFNAILVDRSSRSVSALRAQIGQMTDALDNGESLIIFPEGTRGSNGELGDFQAGMAMLAAHSPDTWFVPVWMDNLQRILPKGEFLPIPILSRVTVGEPFRMNDGEDRRTFLARARTHLLTLGEQS